jgi:hypothetical protein
MALQRLFFDLTEEEVLEIRTAAVTAIKAIKPIMTVGGGGKSMGREFAMPPADILKEANAALKHIDPETYGRRIRTTYSRFVGGCDGL